MTRRSPRQRRRRQKNLKGAGVMLLSLGVLALMGWGLWKTWSTTKTLDPETLCPEQDGPASYWAVVIDGTDPYNRIQWANIRNHFAALKEKVPRHGMLAVFSVPERPQEALRPEVALCNPGTGEDLDMWTGNPELARRRWQEEFNAPLDGLLDTLRAAEALRRSPIMETLQAVRAESGRYDAEEHRLFIVSDMMQHTGAYSHYGRAALRFEALRAQPLFRNLRADLAGWEVTVFYAWRDSPQAQAVQGRAHTAFWDRYFSALGGTLVRVQSIDG